MRDEDGIWCALETSPNVGAEVLRRLADDNCRRDSTYIDWTDEIRIASHDVGEQKAMNHREEPGTEEAFPGLLGRDLNQGGSSESNTAQVCEDVVRDDHSHRQKKPDHAFHYVVDNKMGLSDDQEQCHMRPRELGELELVVPFL